MSIWDKTKPVLASFVVLMGLAFCFSLVERAWAQSGPSGASQPAKVATSQPAKVATPAVPLQVKMPEEVQPPADIKTELEGMKKKYEELKKYKAAGDKTGYKLALMGLLAFILRFLIQLIKRVMDFSGDMAKAKNILPLVALVLGTGACILSHFAGGEPWIMAIVWGLAGPGAVFLHELMNLYKKPKTPEEKLCEAKADVAKAVP